MKYVVEKIPLWHCSLWKIYDKIECSKCLSFRPSIPLSLPFPSSHFLSLLFAQLPNSPTSHLISPSSYPPSSSPPPSASVCVILSSLLSSLLSVFLFFPRHIRPVFCHQRRREKFMGLRHVINDVAVICLGEERRKTEANRINRVNYSFSTRPLLDIASIIFTISLLTSVSPGTCRRSHR